VSLHPERAAFRAHGAVSLHPERAAFRARGEIYPIAEKKCRNRASFLSYGVFCVVFAGVEARNGCIDLHLNVLGILSDRSVQKSPLAKLFEILPDNLRDSLVYWVYEVIGTRIETRR